MTPCIAIVNNAEGASPAIFNVGPGLQARRTGVDARPYMVSLLIPANLPPVGLFELHQLLAAMLVVPTLPG